MSTFAGLVTIESLVGDVVVFARPGSAAGVGSSGRGAPSALGVL